MSRRYVPRPRGIHSSKLVSERGAAWLAHQSGGLGVVGSNPAAPTNKINMLCDYWETATIETVVREASGKRGEGFRELRF
jgi:hypothetical protein